MSFLSQAAQIEAIRTIAKALVGECSDWQIMFVARHVGVIKEEHVAVLENLNDYDLTMLGKYMTEESRKARREWWV